jgi:dTDP-4-dehydrorhamnose reductase
VTSHDRDPFGLEMWGGAECTISRVGEGYRDQSQLSGHLLRDDDIDRVASLGLSALRYPLLWETFAQEPDPERLWAWHEARLARLAAAGIRPILGLVHHGSGPPATNLLAPDFAAGLAAHAAAAARRFPWVRDWTPVNEPLTTARFSALYGHWYPHARDERSFWLALLNQVDAVRGAMAEIRVIHPAARLIQTEDLGRTAATPERAGQAEFDNHRRWASWDMLAGRFTPEHPLWGRLAGMGFADRLQAVADAPCPPDVLGINHYLTSDRFLDHRLELYPAAAHGQSHHGPLADTEAVRVLDPAPGLEGALRECWERYRIPMALTEVHNGCTREEQMRWLHEAWTCATRLRAEGLGIEAVTVWSLFGAYDWDSLLTRPAGSYESGVFDVRGSAPRETALGPLVRSLAAGKAGEHPVLGVAGWWRGHARRKSSGERRPLLITGATGTLGQAFAGACRLRGIDHVLTGRDTIDLCDARSIAAGLDSLNPWAVINCTGWVRVDDAEERRDDCMAINFGGAVALAEACRERDIHYTCFSSDLVFDGLGNRPYVESDVLAPLNLYGMSKAMTDRDIQAAEGRALIVRTASFFSPYDRHNFAVHAAAALRGGQEFRAASDCVTSPTFVPDLVRAVLDLVIDDEVGLWHLANEGALSWADFARSIGEALDLCPSLVDPQPQAAMGWTAKRPGYAPIASERAKILPSLDSAIERFAEVMSAAEL